MLIGISGKIGSGKNALADLIQQEYSDKHFEIKALADKLKKVSSLILNLPLELMYSQEGKNMFLGEWNMSIGEFQQKLGTEAIRENLHNNTWIFSLLGEYSYNKNWLVADVRFKNEAQEIKKRKGLLIRINGDPMDINKNSNRDHSHISETDLDDWSDWDLIIKNRFPMINLKREVINLKNIFPCLKE